jgi:Calx-beta domain
VYGDRLAEPDEYFTVNLTGATGASIYNGTGYGNIQDDEPRLSINSMSVKEGNSGTKVMTFTVTLSAAYDQPVTVHYATQDGSAKVADNDYVATSGTLTFAAGQTSQTISVVIKGDRKTETDEYFNVVLSSVSSNAFIDNAYGWGTILDDDGPKGRR